MRFRWIERLASANVANEPWRAAAALCEEFITGDMLLMHAGLIGSADVSRMREACQALIGRLDISETVARHIFAALVEFSDNVAFYSDLQVDIDGQRHLGGLGFIAAMRDGDKVEAISANPCTPERAAQVIETVKEVNAMDQDEVRRRYREKSRQRTTQDSKGAGLGFLHIARSTRHPMEAHMVPGDDHAILILNAAFSIERK